ncbi:MAG: 6,7-dimethyl-8-ribityllumazine synthase [Chloroflexi bacterium]|nr:6,7-dimethyl-8-ribityllumazine synthase [Chloroflexota bacterium]|tara:strand:- start:3851 stop:4315 length:465 start_codon:yes stop_codon:yes gene_type:complete
MSKEIKSDGDGSNIRIGIVVAEYNEFITFKLLEGAEQTLLGNGVSENDICVSYVPGSFEIPVVANKMASSGKYDAIICLGAVIKGETDHYDYVSEGAAHGIARIALDTGVPVMFGVLTTHNVEQAIDRCGGSKGNEGSACALAAIQTVNVLKQN